MRIGINGRLLLKEKTGVGNYTENLYRHLKKILPEDEILLYDDERKNELLYPPLQKIQKRWIRKPLYLLWLNFLFPSLLKKDGVDLLHSPNFTPPLHLNIKSVVTFHDMVFFKFPELRDSYLYWKYSVKITPILAKVADRVIAISESAKKDILEYLPIDEGKIDVVYEGVEDSFRPIYDQENLEDCRKRYNLPSKFILSLGAIEPRKNLINLVKAYANVLKVNSQLSEIKLVIAGKRASGYAELLKTIKDLSFQDQIIFTGYIPEADLPLIYNLAKVLAFPSLYEGFGLPPIEAMACGIPVLVSNIPALREVVGDAGGLVNPLDTGDIAKSLYNLLTDSALYSKMRGRGLSRSKFFSWERCARETLKVYEKTLVVPKSDTH